MRAFSHKPFYGKRYLSYPLFINRKMQKPPCQTGHTVAESFADHTGLFFRLSRKSKNNPHPYERENACGIAPLSCFISSYYLYHLFNPYGPLTPLILCTDNPCANIPAARQNYHTKDIKSCYPLRAVTDTHSPWQFTSRISSPAASTACLTIPSLSSIMPDVI